MINWNTISTISVDSLRAELRTNYAVSLPEEIISIDDMYAVQKLLSRYSANYSFLSAMEIEAKSMKRKAKREKAGKEIIESYLEKEELFHTYAENMKMAYSSLSRMISVRQQINEELKMTHALT